MDPQTTPTKTMPDDAMQGCAFQGLAPEQAVELLLIQGKYLQMEVAIAAQMTPEPPGTAAHRDMSPLGR